jgi:hypothetical protein
LPIAAIKVGKYQQENTEIQFELVVPEGLGFLIICMKKSNVSVVKIVYELLTWYMSNAVLKSLMCLDVKLIYKWLSWCKSSAIGCEDHIQIIEICTWKLSPCLQFVSKLHDTPVLVWYIGTCAAYQHQYQGTYLPGWYILRQCHPCTNASLVGMWVDISFNNKYMFLSHQQNIGLGHRNKLVWNFKKRTQYWEQISIGIQKLILDWCYNRSIKLLGINDEKWFCYYKLRLYQFCECKCQ